MAGVDALDELRAADARTRAAGNARAVFAFGWKLPAREQVPRRGPLAFIGNAADRVALRFLKATFLHRHVCEGVLDLPGRRYMLDHGEYAEVHMHGRRWAGRSGSELSTLRPDRGAFPSPLWLVDILSRATHATFAGGEVVRGTPCRRVRATLDLRDGPPAGAAASSPSLAGIESLHAVPVDVWLDGAHVRRIRLASPHYEEAMELWSVGAVPDDLDWTRLPTFRTGDR